MKLSSNSNFSTFTQNDLAKSVLKSNNSVLPLGTFSTQNSYFSLSTHNSSAASALAKNVSSFSFNSDNSFLLIALILELLFESNSNPKSNLVPKDFFFYQNDIHMFTNNIYNIKTIKIKETFKKT